MATYICKICQYEYDEEKEGLKWEDLPADWVCPVCHAQKTLFYKKGAEETPAVESGKSAAAQPTVSDVMVETMVNWGVTHVFGMVGHSNLGLADAVRKKCETGDLNYIGIRHEGAASFAASAFAKLSGRPAACLAIAGPGATNLLTGLWDAKLDRAPVLALTGQVDLQFLGPGSFQEIDLSSAFEAVACWQQTVLEGSNHVELMNLALKNAIQRRDVVQLIFPNKLQDIPAPAGAQASSPVGRTSSQTIKPPDDSVEAAAAEFRKAKRPAIIAGYGARFCMDEVIAFAEKFNVPVITTFKAKGLIPDAHPLACGVLGLSGTPIASRAMSEADLLVVLGASFSKHTGILKDKPIIQVDFDQIMLGKFHPVTVPMWGEIGESVKLLSGALEKDPAKNDPREELAAQWADWRETKKKRAAENNGNGISSAALFEAMTAAVPENAVVAVDVGNNTYSFGRYFECSAQSIIMSGYLGSIGFGYPAAMGAWAAAPERPIVAVTGDGGFGQYMAELTTAVKYGMPIKHILLNNNELGKISKEQRDEHRPVWSTSLHNPDFSKYAQDCGALGIRVSEVSELEESLKKVIDHNGPAMLEVITDPMLI